VTTVTVVVAHISPVPATETKAFVPQPYAQAALTNILKLQKENQKFLGYFKQNPTFASARGTRRSVREQQQPRSLRFLCHTHANASQLGAPNKEADTRPVEGSSRAQRSGRQLRGNAANHWTAHRDPGPLGRL